MLFLFEPDRPIESSEFDHLGRALFACSLGEAIMSYYQTESVVLALYGPWGSGKTSLINIAIEHILDFSSKWEKSKQPIVMRFNPWMFSNQNQLITQFFRQLKATLGKADTAQLSKEVGETIEDYASFFEPLKYVPSLGTQLAGRIAIPVGRGLGGFLKKRGERKAADLEASKKDLHKILRGFERKLIIIIDDIDRLNKEEIRQIFQLVKSIADFPNIIYWLAFDKEVVLKALEDVQGNGLDYLEKIVQVPVEIPPIDPAELEKLLVNRLNVVLENLPKERFDSNYWGNLYLSCIRYFFNNMRDVNRYINTFRFNYGLIQEEVNVVDLLAITAIQVFLPDTYSEIQEHKEIFAGVFGSWDGAKNKKEEATNECNRILESITYPPVRAVKEMLIRIFPKLETIYNNIYHGYDGLSSLRRDRRICSLIPSIYILGCQFQLESCLNETWSLYYSKSPTRVNSRKPCFH